VTPEGMDLDPESRIQLERLFDREMRALYDAWRTKCNYRATRFLRLVKNRGGLEAAKKLLGSRGVSQGFTALTELGSLDLTVEALVLQPPWRSLFSDQEIAVAFKRILAAKRTA